MASEGNHQRTPDQEEDWAILPLPDEKETIEGLLTSLRLRGDEACQLVAEVKKLLDKREAEVGRRCELEKEALELQLKSKNADLNKQLLRAQQDIRKCHEKMDHLQKKKHHTLGEEEKSPASSTLVHHQLQRELADTKAMREKDQEVIEKLRKELSENEVKTEELEQKIAQDLSEVTKSHVQLAAMDGLFTKGKSLEPAAVEQILIQSELAQKQHKKHIRELKKETERKDKHMERMNQRILELQKEKVLLEKNMKRLSIAEADVTRLVEQKAQLLKELEGYREDKRFLEICVTQLKADLPSEELERFQVLTDEVTAKQIAVQDLRQQVTDYETMIRDYCKELGEAAEMQNLQQRKVQQLESRNDQLQAEVDQLQGKIDQLQGELAVATVQNELFENDFKQEREDREHAHSLLADKDKELMQALSMIRELQQHQPQSSSQKQTGSRGPRRAVHTQPQMTTKPQKTAKQVAELEEARATAVQQIKSYKTQADGYKKDLEVERKRTCELKEQLESLKKTKPASDVREKVHSMDHDLQKARKELKDAYADCTRLRKLNQNLWRKLQDVMGMDDTQLPGETPAHRLPANDSNSHELLAAARPGQERQEDPRGNVSLTGQSQFPLSSTEEHRMHAATFQEKPQQRPGSGNTMEMEVHSKNPERTTGEQQSSTLAVLNPAQADAKSPLVVASQSEDASDTTSKAEPVVIGMNKYSAPNPSDFPDGDHWQQRTNDVAKPPEPEETMVGENKLVAGIDQEIEDVALEVREMVQEPVMTNVQRPVGSFEIPADPNLVCPKCQKRFKHGEIQKLRLHYHQCKN